VFPLRPSLLEGARDPENRTLVENFFSLSIFNKIGSPRSLGILPGGEGESFSPL